MEVRSVREWVAVVAVALVLIGSGASTLKAGQGNIPTPWLDQDIGSPAVAGSASSSGSTFTISAGGSDIWGTSDQFHFVYQQVTGDVDVRARVDSLTKMSAWSKAGVMIRSDLTAGAAHGFAVVSAGKGAAFQRRTQTGGNSTNTGGPFVAAPEWVRVVRRGTMVSAYTSADGTTWALVGQDTIELGAAAYVGLAVTSHNVSAATTAVASQVTVTPVSLPAGQQHADIGSPALAGDATDSNGTYRIHAGGVDIWDAADQFHYVYQPVSGDVDVSLRVASLSYANAWSKAGVMIRETLGAGSTHAFTLLSAGKGFAFQRRPIGGDLSLNTSAGTGAVPGWVRLKRSGSLFTAYRSTDGRNWTVIGSDNITMADAVYVGIAVTSHNETTAVDAVVDSLTVTQTSTANQPPAVSLTSPASGATFTAPASIAIAASASDPENQLTKVDFYSGATLLGTDTTAPYAFTWASVPAGTYSLTARAYDAAGASTTSAAVSVTVTASTSTPPTGVVFQASVDHATLASYRVEVFASGADTSTATPISSIDVGKPAPDANNDITVSIPSFFQALAPGNYQMTVAAVSGTLFTRSAPLLFTR